MLGAKYRNRLWAYVEERLDTSKRARDLVKAGLQDLGSRIDKLDELANKGTCKYYPIRSGPVINRSCYSDL